MEMAYIIALSMNLFSMEMYEIDNEYLFPFSVLTLSRMQRVE